MGRALKLLSCGDTRVQRCFTAGAGADLTESVGSGIALRETILKPKPSPRRIRRNCPGRPCLIVTKGLYPQDALPFSVQRGAVRCFTADTVSITAGKKNHESWEEAKASLSSRRKRTSRFQNSPEQQEALRGPGELAAAGAPGAPGRNHLDGGLRGKPGVVFGNSKHAGLARLQGELASRRGRRPAAPPLQAGPLGGTGESPGPSY